MTAKIKNCYDIIKKEAPKLLVKSDNPNRDLHGLDLPLRMVIIAPSGSGMTNMLVT